MNHKNSGGSLIISLNVRLNLCLGVPLKDDQAEITLYPCNRTSELQSWECRNEKILAIQGEDLFFSPDNEEHDNVVLNKRLSAKNMGKFYGPWMFYVPRDMKVQKIDSFILCSNFFVSIRMFWIFGSDYSDSFGDHQSLRKTVH